MAAPGTKLAKLEGFMADGDIKSALRLANSFPQLGDEKKAITQAWSALNNPDFYREIGHCPDALVAAGIAAIRARYNLPETLHR